jgi:hypothetical protein
MSYDETNLPHSFQVRPRIPQDTNLLTADGKRIFKAPEPVGYVAPKDHKKYIVKE